MVTFRRYCIIALLFFSAGAFGQLQLVSVGAVASSNSAQAETYEYADSDSIEVIHVINFDQYSAQVAPLISYLEAGMPYGGYIGADTGTVADHIELVDYGGGDIILKANYKEGWCCTEQEVGTVDSAGTAILWREDIPTAMGERDTIFVTSVIFIDPAYESGDGIKMIGAYNEPDGARDRRSSRPMFIDGDGDSVIYFFYDYAYDNSADASNSAKPTYGQTSGYDPYKDLMPVGEWISVTVKLYSGTTDSYNASHAFWRNDTCQDYRSSIMMNNSTDGFAAWDMIDISLFAGGDQNSYNMPVDTWIYVKTAVMWKTINGYSVFPDMIATPAHLSTIKLPEETEWSNNLSDPE
jgi:hypothetical protein